MTAAAVGINRKNIYREVKRPQQDQTLKQQIEAVHRQHPAYGHRRIALHPNINRKRAQRRFKLRPPRRRVKSYCTRSTPHHRHINLLKDTAPITQPHQVWCSDLTRIEYRGAIWYLASIEDLATRQIIAHRIAKHHDSQLVLDTLCQAFATGASPYIFHSDQGSEFIAQRCTDYLQQHAVQISVSHVASPWQNAYIESFFGRFKLEVGDVNRFDSPSEMLEAIYSYIRYYTMTAFIRPSRCHLPCTLNNLPQTLVFINWVLDMGSLQYD